MNHILLLVELTVYEWPPIIFSMKEAENRIGLLYLLFQIIFLGLCPIFRGFMAEYHSSMPLLTKTIKYIRSAGK